MKEQHSIEDQTASFVAFGFVLVILIYAASGPIGEFVSWFIETTTDDFDELSRRDKRLLLKSHWLGASYRILEKGFLLPTGLILGLPILFSFTISFLMVPQRARWLNWALAGISIAVYLTWVVKLFAVDGGAIPSAETADYYLFSLAVLLTLYLTQRQFGTFIVGFCLFWVIYFFVRGWMPDWTGIFAGSESTFGQSMRSMVLNFWAQTGGIFGQPLQVVSGNVLIFIVFQY
jgi:TRAP-type uncharacterized transport system fused permease subunit